MKSKKELDIYVDETGDESQYSKANPLYIVSFVCVENVKLNDFAVDCLKNKLSSLKGGDSFVHTGSLVRNEEPYKDLLREDREKLFGALFFFARKTNFLFFNAVLDKKVHQEKPLGERVGDVIADAIRERKKYFDKFDVVRLHYDGGQDFLRGIFTATVKYVFNKGSYVSTSQKETPFMQLADMVGFMELLWFKANNGTLTKSDEKFFGKKQKIYKDYLKFLLSKKI